MTNTATMRTVSLAPGWPRRTWRSNVNRFEAISPPSVMSPRALMTSNTEYSWSNRADP